MGREGLPLSHSQYVQTQAYSVILDVFPKGVIKPHLGFIILWLTIHLYN